MPVVTSPSKRAGYTFVPEGVGIIPCQHYPRPERHRQRQHQRRRRLSPEEEAGVGVPAASVAGKVHLEKG